MQMNLGVYRARMTTYLYECPITEYRIRERFHGGVAKLFAINDIYVGDDAAVICVLCVVVSGSRN